MKKIMFSDKYHLTEAVLEGRKTQTRRIFHLTAQHLVRFISGELSDEAIIDMYSRYKVGEVLSVAQSYNDIIQNTFDKGGEFKATCGILRSAGLTNKMFVKAELMPHHIRITNIRVERLQDISDDDCLAEGISVFNEKWYFVKGIKIKHLIIRHKGIDGKWQTFKWQVYETLRYAYAALIDRVSGNGTWNSNPYVFVYDFELVD